MRLEKGKGPGPLLWSLRRHTSEVSFREQLGADQVRPRREAFGHFISGLRLKGTQCKFSRPSGTAGPNPTISLTITVIYRVFDRQAKRGGRSKLTQAPC